MNSILRNKAWRVRLFRGLVGVVLVSAMPDEAFSQSSRGDNAGSAAECFKVALTEKPQWISSAAFVPAGNKIAVVDTLTNRILLVSPQGEVSQSLDARPETKKFLPALITEAGDGYLLSLIGSETLMLDSALKPKGSMAVPLKGASTTSGVRSVYQWAVAANSVVGYGTVGVPEKGKPYQVGFFSKPLNSSRVSLFKPFENGDFYVLGMQYMASLGNKAYFVLMDGSASIYEVNPVNGRLRELKAFPEEYRATLPLQTPMTGPSSAADLYREIEGRSLPAGLYGQDGKLYLLTRKPGDEGTTVWTLYQIDPKADRLVGEPLVLPTKANHITLVPTPSTWYAFEKGSVQGLGFHDISFMLSIPGSWLRSPDSSPLNLKAARRVEACRTPGR